MSEGKQDEWDQDGSASDSRGSVQCDSDTTITHEAGNAESGMKKVVLTQPNVMDRKIDTNAEGNQGGWDQGGCASDS